jgi:hypothetical protein
MNKPDWTSPPVFVLLALPVVVKTPPNFGNLPVKAVAAPTKANVDTRRSLIVAEREKRESGSYTM